MLDIYAVLVERALRASSYADLNAVGHEAIRYFSSGRLVDAEFRCFSILFINICAANGWLND